MDRIVHSDNDGDITISKLASDGKYLLTCTADEFVLDTDQLTQLINELIDHQEDSEIE